MINGLATTAEVSTLSGATVRQLNHWVAKGWITPLNTGRGQGEPLQWRPADRRRACLMMQLIGAGFTAGAAHDIMDKIMESWPNLADVGVHLSDSVHLRIRVRS